MSDVYEFTATHGVHLADLDVHFQRDARVADSAVYRFETADAEKAAALRDLGLYGIEQVGEPEKVKAPTAAEKKAAKEAAEKAAAEATEREADEQAAASRPADEDQK